MPSSAGMVKNRAFGMASCATNPLSCMPSSSGPCGVARVFPSSTAGQHAEVSRRVALDERPLAAGGQGEVERAEDEPEVPQVSEECALSVGRGLDRRIRVGAVVGAPVEQTGVDPHREHTAADHGYPYVGDFVDAGLKQVHRPGDAVVDLAGVDLVDEHGLRLAIDQVQRHRQRFEDHWPVFLDERLCVVGPVGDQRRRQREPARGRGGEPGRLLLGVADAVRVVDIEAVGQRDEDAVESVPCLRGSESGVLLVEVREREPGRAPVVQRPYAVEIGDAGRGREASKMLAQRRRGIGDESAASQNRSVGS